MNELLSICIPTYNRGAFLEGTLNNFIEQVKKYEIPIYISDNDSNDNTQSVVNKCKKKYEFIFYDKNEYNIGFDNNVLKVVSMASSKYVWIFGDDDQIKEGSIDYITPQLYKDYDLVIINATTHSFDLSRVVEERKNEVYKDKIYLESECNSLLEELGAYTTFIGALIVNKKLWDNELVNGNFDKKDFIHCEIIYRYICNRKTLFIAYPYINIRLGNATWANRKFEIWMMNWSGCIWKLPLHYTDETKSKVVHLNNRNFSIKAILLQAALGSYSIKEYDQFIKNNPSMSQVKKYICRGIVYLEGNILTMSAYLYLRLYIQMVRNKNVKLLLYDLESLLKQKK